jgi:hypothetical protein
MKVKEGLILLLYALSHKRIILHKKRKLIFVIFDFFKNVMTNIS